MSELTSAEPEGLAAPQVPGYRVEQTVGRGATGTVFRAQDEQHGQPVALKIIGPPRAADQAFASRLLRDTQAASAVGEPHILPVLQAGEANGNLFVVMPYINGGDARSLVSREGPLLPQRVAPIVWRVASALDAAHATGLVHGDVKPGNILVDSRPGQPDLVYLSDFGQGRSPTSGPVMAGTAEASETVDCIAPEQVEGKQADGRADQYALACVAFELLTGVRPFRPDDPAAMRRPEPPRATSIRPGLPPAVDEVLGRALAQVVAYRYASCRAFADALHGAFWPGSSPGQPPAGPPPAAVPAVSDAALGVDGVPAGYGAGPGPVAVPAMYDAAPVPDGVPAMYDAGPGPDGVPAMYDAGPGPGGVPAMYDAGPGPGGVPAMYDAGPGPGGAPAMYDAAAGPGWLAAPPGAAGAATDAPSGLYLTSAPPPGLAPGAPAPGAPGAGAPAPGVPGAGAPLPGGEPWLASGGGRRRHFGTTPLVLAGVAVLVVAVLAAGLVVGLHGHGGGGTSNPTARIAAKSANPPAGGDVWTMYGLGNLANAQIKGSITGAASGEVARLYAQPFPFSSPAAPVSSPVLLHPSGKAAKAAYSFQVTPSLATRYHVEVFKSSAAASALTSSSTTTVYVTVGYTEVSKGKPCGRPVCHKTITGDVFVPASALNTEVSKKVFLYFGINLNSGKTVPPQPTTLVLGAGDAQATTKPISASEYEQIVTLTFTIGPKDQYDYIWNACTQDTEAQDGLGLPGHHGCGDPTVPNPAGYIG